MSGEVRIYFEEGGVGDPGLVLVHGGGCDHTTMTDLARSASSSRHVINVDLRGHGKSDKPSAGYSPATFTDDLGAAILARFDDPVVVVGHSMGGRVVLELARRRPELVCAVVLLDNRVDEDPAYVADRRGSFAADDWRDSLERRAHSMFLAEDRSSRREQIIRGMLDAPRDISAAVLDAVDQIDTPRAFRDCAVPVLYIGGTHPRADPRRLLELRPDLVWGQVVGAGHFVQIDAARQVNAMIERFIQVHVAPREAE